MKTYTDFATWPEYVDAFNSSMADKLPIAVIHKTLGSLQLVKLEARDKDIFVTLTDSFTAPCTYSLIWLVEHQKLTLTDGSSELLATLVEEFKLSLDAKVAEEREQKLRQEAERIKAIEEAKEQARLAEKKRKLDLKIQSMRPMSLTTDYELIGWMASHVSTISATVNSDYEAWFQKNFGIVDHTVVSADAETATGNPMKYSLSFRAGFTSELPAVLRRGEGVGTKVINSVAYIWDLIDKYSFRFGKTQDLEAIRKCIPAEYLEDFERGFASDPVTKKTRKAKAKAAA